MTRSLIALSMCASLLAPAAWSQERGATSRAQLDVTSFGLVTLAPGQTARLNVVNAAIADPRLPPGPCLQDPRLPPGPCVVHLTVRDGSGAVVASATETLAPGQAASLEITGDATSGRAHRLIWATIAVETADLRASALRLPPNPCLATLEVVDADTGRTVLVHPGTALRQIVEAGAPVAEDRR